MSNSFMTHVNSAVLSWGKDAMICENLIVAERRKLKITICYSWNEGSFVNIVVIVKSEHRSERYPLAFFTSNKAFVMSKPHVRKFEPIINGKAIINKAMGERTRLNSKTRNAPNTLVEWVQSKFLSISGRLSSNSFSSIIVMSLLTDIMLLAALITFESLHLDFPSTLSR